MHRRTIPLLALLSLAASLGSLLLAPRPAGAQPAPLIVSIEVEKNAYISRDAILDAVKDILKVGEPFTEQKAADARKAVENMRYFAAVEVSEQAVAQGIKVIITVVERLRIEKITFVGNTVFTDAVLLGVMRTRVGNMVDNDAIGRDVDRLEGYYKAQGYLGRVTQAQVDARGVLSVVIEERRIERFKIEGLHKTKEWVVRRMIQTRPGVLFQQSMVQRDLRRIFDVGIFQNISIDVRNGEADPTAVIVVIKLEEKRTGTASVAAAYSDLDHFVMMLSVGETNFRGRAEKVSANIEAFGRSSYDLNFTEPFVDKKNTTMNLSLFDTERRRQFIGGGGIDITNARFDERRTGASVRFSRPVSTTQHVAISLRTESVTSSSLLATRDLGPLQGGGVQPFSVRPQQTGGLGRIIPVDPNAPTPPGGFPGDLIIAAPLHPPGHVNSTTVEYSWDTRDSALDAKRGSYRNLSVQVSGGVLGGVSAYTLYSLDQRKYLPMRRGLDVIAMRLMGGISSGNLPLFDSFSAGGATSLRGYQEDRFRGERMVLGNVEYRYHLSDSLQLVGFVDGGDAFGGTFPTTVPGFNVPAEDQKLTLHLDAGFGLRAQTPLGPIRVDLGYGKQGSQIGIGFGNIF